MNAAIRTTSDAVGMSLVEAFDAAGLAPRTWAVVLSACSPAKLTCSGDPARSEVPPWGLSWFRRIVCCFSWSPRTPDRSRHHSSGRRRADRGQACLVFRTEFPLNVFSGAGLVSPATDWMSTSPPREPAPRRRTCKPCRCVRNRRCLRTPITYPLGDFDICGIAESVVRPVVRAPIGATTGANLCRCFTVSSENRLT